MSVILIKCPETGEAVRTGHSSTFESFAADEFPGASFRCSACGKVHEWAKVDAWLSTATEGDQMRSIFGG